MQDTLLTINAGSSSIRFAFYHRDPEYTRLSSGHIKNIGEEEATFHFSEEDQTDPVGHSLKMKSYPDCVDFLVEWIAARPEMNGLRAIGHRIVYGLNHEAPVIITSQILQELHQTMKYDPEHMPGTLSLIEKLQIKFPAVPQIACFDSSFHTSMPEVARMLPLPRRYFEKGIRRYGFHGLSYAYLMEQLVKLDGQEAAQGKVILLHLGNGASLAAVRFGKSQDTSMGFSPASGIIMSTRSGDIDPGLAWYFMQEEQMNPDQFIHLVNYESGLLGVSGSTGNLEELMKSKNTDARAAAAVEMFCYQIKKYIGAFATVLGGVDTIVFSGGIGANSPAIREKICFGLQFLGIQLDFTRNRSNEQIISDHSAAVKIRVMKTNEELMIARFTAATIVTGTMPESNPDPSNRMP